MATPYSIQQLRASDPNIAAREALRARIAEAFGPDRSMLADQAAQGIRNYNLQGLTDQRAIADREAGFNLARRGQVGSSAEIDSLRDRGRVTDDALRGTETDALSAANAFRAGDVNAQSSLYGNVNAGLGTGEQITDALKALQFQSQQNQDFIRGRSIGNAADQFSTLASAYGIGNARKKAQADYPMYAGTLFK